MKIWKTRDGEKINAKEFKKRFKEGIENITPKQKLHNDFISSIIIFIGYLVGMVALIVFWDKLIVGWFSFGLILIFAGMAYSTFVKLLVTRQQIKSFDSIDEQSLKGKLEELFQDNVEKGGKS